MKHPSFWQVWYYEGLRAAINHKTERMCVGAIANMIRENKRRGVNPMKRDRVPWWFSIASRIEFATRRKSK